MASSSGGKTERRSGRERRQRERRHSMRYASDTVIIVSGITWVDNEGTDRRRRVRRRADREALAEKIIKGSFE